MGQVEKLHLLLSMTGPILMAQLLPSWEAAFPGLSSPRWFCFSDKRIRACMPAILSLAGRSPRGSFISVQAAGPALLMSPPSLECVPCMTRYPLLFASYRHDIESQGFGLSKAQRLPLLLLQHWRHGL